MSGGVGVEAPAGKRSDNDFPLDKKSSMASTTINAASTKREVAGGILASAEVLASLHMSSGELASALQAYGLPRARSRTGGLAARAAEVGHEALPAAAQG